MKRKNTIERRVGKTCGTWLNIHIFRNKKTKSCENGQKLNLRTYDCIFKKSKR